jgi:hypothetical protein
MAGTVCFLLIELATLLLYGTIPPIYIKEAAMNKRLLLLLVLLTALAAGCCEQPEPTQEPEPTKVPLPQPTAEIAVEPQEAFCVAEPLELPVEPRIPPVTEADHVHGPADAPITIIEYADFQ